VISLQALAALDFTTDHQMVCSSRVVVPHWLRNVAFGERKNRAAQGLFLTRMEGLPGG